MKFLRSYVVMKDWQRSGYVGDMTAAEEKIDTILQYNYSKGQMPVALIMKEGVFLN